MLGAVALAALACGPGSAQRARWAELAPAGREVYETESCGACHGATLAGSRTGPALRGLARHLSEDELVSFLRNPAARLRSDRRLARISKGFPGRMSGLPAADEQRLRALAGYLLSR